MFLFIRFSICIVSSALETVKVFMQVSSSLSRTANATVTRTGIFRTGADIVARDGIQALYTGISPALLRQCLYGGLSVGSYQIVLRSLFAPPDAPASWAHAGGGATFSQKFVAGALSGGVAQLLTSPTDTIRIRMQADRRNLLMHQVPERYKSMWHAFKTIVRDEGVVNGLFVGASVNTARAAVMNSLWMASYDQSKSKLLESGFPGGDGHLLHAVCSQISGAASALIAAPMDNVRTLMISQYQSGPPKISSAPPPLPATISPKLASVAAAAAPHVTPIAVATPTVHRSAWACFQYVRKTEGLPGLYRGFLPSLIRGNLWSFSFFMLYEDVYKLVFGTSF
jgi:hypothetical protein